MIDLGTGRALTRHFFLAVLALPVVANAQVGGGKSDAKECEKAAKVVAKGHAAEKMAAAVSTLSTCSTVATDALIAGLSQYAHESDPLVLEEFMHEIDTWRDGQIFEAVTALATNTAAAPSARVFAVRHLLLLAHPFLVYSYSGLIVGEVTTSDADLVKTTIGCRVMMSSESAGKMATPLPPNYASLIESTLASLAVSPSTPMIVRNAARCVR